MGSGASAAEIAQTIENASDDDLMSAAKDMDAASLAKLKSAMMDSKPKPKVLFVLGGPGAGKGTQCEKIIENFAEWGHISAGDCLRAERQNPDSKDGEMINGFIKEGKIVPVAITIKLIQKAMTAAAGKTCFLIDGFPRNKDNVTGWMENVGDNADVAGCLFYEATEDELTKRLLGRGQGRDDDNIETIKKRFKTYMDETQPVADMFKDKGQLISINGMRAIDEVWGDTRKVIQNIMAKPKVLFVLGGPGAGKGTQCTKIIENFPDWAHISAGDCLRAERQNPDSKDGELINNFIKEGKIVPVAITIKLIQKAMMASGGKCCFLIDGFPRNADNVKGWTENVGSMADVAGCLFYEANEEELTKRLLARGQGRDDDNIETIQKRFKTYVAETKPVTDIYKEKGELISIDGMKAIDEVWESTKKVIQDIEAKK